MAIEDYLKEFKRVLEGRDEKDSWPTEKDLKPGRIYIDRKSYLDAQSFLQEHRYCLVEGAERRGKTTLVRFIGLQYLKDGWYVAQIDVSRVLDISDLAPFIDLLEEGFYDRSKNLFIIEDCHMKPQVSDKLLKTVEECQEASFLFTLRTVEQGEKILVEDPFEDSVIRENDWVVCLDASEKTIYNNIKGIVNKFAKNNESDLMRKSKPAPTHEDYQYLVEQTGGNKLILNYYLEAWRGAEAPGLPLQKTDRKLVLEQFRKERLRGFSRNQLTVLKSISVLGQFEIPIFIEPLFPSDVFSATQEVSSLRGLAFNLPPDTWLLADTESKFTLECLGASESFICSILKTYVKEAPNYSEVFRALQRAQKRELLISLIVDIEVFNSLVSRLKNTETTLGESLYVLRAIAGVDKVKALDLWREYRKPFGEKFFDEVQRKLSEPHEIWITTGLLNFLRTIDKEGEAVPLANTLPAELFISKSQLEITGFKSFVNKLYTLRSLSPEIIKRVLKCLDDSDYRRLGEKARKHRLQNIQWFLRLLAIQTESKAATDAFLKGLGLNVLLEMIMSSPFTVAGRAIDFLYAIAPEKATLALKSLDKSDYKRLGELARNSSLQRINWFLRRLGDDEGLKSFGSTFLEAIGTEQIVEKIKSSNISLFRDFEKYTNRVIQGWVGKLTGRTDFPWDELLENASVSNLANTFCAWVQFHNPNIREQRKIIVRHWSAADLPWGKGQQEQFVKHMGRLLLYSYYLDEDVAKRLTTKATATFAPKTMEYTLEHLAQLLKNSRRCNPNAAQQLVEKIFSNDATFLSSKGDLNWFCRLLWESVLSNESRTKRWVTEVKGTFWEDLTVNASHSDIFYLLLVLWQVNGEIGREVTNAVGQRLLTSANLSDDPQALPLLGFFAFCGLNPKVNRTFPIEENVDKLCTYPINIRLACSLFYLQDLEPEIIPVFIKAALTLKGIKPETALLLAEHPLPWAASTLADILVSAKNESRIESEDVYDRAILLFSAIQRTVIYMNTLLNEMRAPQFTHQLDLALEAESDIKREEQKTRSWATIRLNNAIDKGIFTVQNIENPITHKASRRLGLNWDNHQVTFALDVTKDLLLALPIVQKVKAWADYNTWDATFVSNWTGEPLSQQQLRYWQGILLKMNMIKVDYKETKRGYWTIVFGVNIEHPLIKSFITV